MEKSKECINNGEESPEVELRKEQGSVGIKRKYVCEQVVHAVSRQCCFSRDKICIR